MKVASLIGMLIVIGLILTVGVIKCSKPKEVPVALNVKLQPIKTTIYTSQMIMFDVIMRSNVQTLAMMTVTIKDSSGEKIIIPDTANITRNLTKRYKISAPDSLTNGTYELILEVNYSNRKILAKTPIFVKSIPGLPRTSTTTELEATNPRLIEFQKMNTTNQTNETTPTTTLPAPRQEDTQTTPTTSKNYTVTQDTKTEIPKAVLDNCPEDRLDRCMLDYSAQANDSKYCSAIEDRNVKDTCYRNFVEAGDLTKCQYISFVEYREYCEEIIAYQKSAGAGAIQALALPYAGWTYQIETIEDI